MTIEPTHLWVNIVCPVRAAEWQAIYEAEQIIDADVLELEYVDLTQTADHS
jgi:hypothetical protein